MNTFHVCIVDDDPMARMIAADALAEFHCRITECETGAECLALFDPFASEPAPDLVLLDIEMPEMDGYEVCRRLRSEGNDAVQIIFVSGHDDLDSRLTGFDVGGSGFVVKPYALKELKHHVALVAAQARRQSDQSEQLNYARKTAFSAMSSMGEMGAVLQFMRDSFACRDTNDLAHKVFDVTRAYDLTALLALRHGDQVDCFNYAGTGNELEISILDYVRHMPRIQQLGDRLVINYPQASLVVLDLPTGDSEKVDRLRDHLAIVAEGADARVQGMTLEAEQAAQAQGIREAIVALASTFKKTEELQEIHRRTALDVAKSFHEKLLYAFLSMGLSEQQERELTELADGSMEEIAALMEEQATLALRLQDVTARLQGLLVQPG